ncbi:MAG: NUDIX hydrolase [Patescibacteria group bacterium]|jgi:ADP-ribose pyrophosphatase YjhB (NUDIX family)
MSFIDPEIYYKSLPKKRSAAGAIILNQADEILFVKSDYKNYWSIPGGATEENESPRETCIRETKEEVGIDLLNPKLLCVDYVSGKDGKGENFQFIFFGGKLSPAAIKKIKVDGQEIKEYRFMPITEAWPMLNKKYQNRLPACLKALKDDTAIYFENDKY